jgi:2-polyprenyl-3-methyl-5-hydroxy-6-metoxy-1,4-benzoquinol methylase
MTETLSTFDAAKAENFATKLLATLNHGATCLMISIGHRTGLFDVMSGMAPSTSQEISKRAGLDERYVREWLGAMVTGGLVELEPETFRFRLPDEHAAFLCRASAADNMAAFTQYVAVLGGVEDDIVNCFRHGGGVPYEKFPRFHTVMAEDSGQSVLSSLESHVLPLVPGMIEELAEGAGLLDVGCGSGRIVNRLAELYPKSSFTGLDLAGEAIRAARAEARSKGLANVRFEAVDLSDFDHMAEPDAFDFITAFDAVHDQAQPLRLLKGVCRALKDDGTFLMQDIRGSSHLAKNLQHPLGPLLYTISCMHCMTVSLAQGGEGLGAMWGEEKAREYLHQAGFRSVQKRELAHDIQNNWYVVTK